MSVELFGLQLPLARFTLKVDATLRGRVTAFFGASGAGKTALLEIIAGLRRPVAGVVRVDGVVLTDSVAKNFVPPEKRSIAYVPQEGALFPHLSVRQNLLYGCDLARPRPSGLNFEHVTEVLEIAPLIGRGVGALSGGEKQRVALGRALLAAPRLLLLDEPLAGLDAPLRERLLPYLARVRDEFAIPMIYVTHSPDEVMELCDEVLLIAEGRVGYHAKPAEVFVPATSARYMLDPKLDL
ncbi:MAG TPA: ATP-binding cassette domain-containing protein [Candidatus Didemnitutus sp.]|nr:ATP-binding cassette domain-containing protein [Candidatus Didemnitutus sp.]